MTYDRVTKSMWEAENCVSVRLFSAAPSPVSSKEVRGREKGQALPQLLCACQTEQSFYLRLLQAMSLRNPTDLQRVWKQIHHLLQERWLSKLVLAQPHSPGPLQPFNVWNTSAVLQHHWRITLWDTKPWETEKPQTTKPARRVNTTVYPKERQEHTGYWGK